jgi:hypothetical protein
MSPLVPEPAGPVRSRLNPGSKTAERYCYADTASLIETGSHLILSLYVDREPDDYWDEPGGQQFAAGGTGPNGR